MTDQRNPYVPGLESGYLANGSLARTDDGLAHGRRILIWGPGGIGKSTLTSHLAARLAGEGVSCAAVSADPGSPSFGVPGALALARWRSGGWEVDRLAALCTLDALGYRLTLVQALSRLAALVPEGPLLVDAPGVTRGPPAEELLDAMLQAATIDTLLAILPEAGAARGHAEKLLDGLRCQVLIRAPQPLAHKLTAKERARDRTLVWDAWLEQAVQTEISLSRLRLRGVPAPKSDEWRGRQIALIEPGGETRALGEVLAWKSDRILARLRQVGRGDLDGALCLIRDAARGPEGLLGTAKPARSAPPEAAVPPDLICPDRAGADPACFVHLGVASALLVNGLFGDPLVHLRLRQEGRSLFFDLGDGQRVPARIAHQVTDVFISHAHMDHIGGFLWFLRSRIGETGSCRLYGPPGLADHVCAFIDGVRWDRIADRGPRFEVLELHGEHLRRFLVQVGLPKGEGREQPVLGGVLLDESGFRVRAITLDHGIPVLAFAFEVPQTFRIRKDRLAASGLPGGPWAGTLKRCMTEGREAMQITLPDGRTMLASRLADELVDRHPPRRLVYATDLANSAANRRRLIGLARGADVLICEAAFSGAHNAHAVRTGHLTAPACGEIAAQAGVARLVPFHFSRRYEADTEVLYREIEAVFKGAVIRSSKISSRP
jgi:ribonuclease Z